MTMKIALLSDVHANLRALEACLAHAKDEGASHHALLGDLVGYGPQPAEVVQRVRELSAQGAVVVKGNHDEMAVSPPAQARTQGERGAVWTHEQLDDHHRAFLDNLPLSVTVGAVLLVHASADAPSHWHYVDSEPRAHASLSAACKNTDVHYVFGGHVHHQTLYFSGAGQRLMRFVPTPGVAIPVPPHRHWIATVGSVGQPRDGNPQAMYAMFDVARAELTFHRVGYDHLAAAADVRASGLPPQFAERLEQGR